MQEIDNPILSELRLALYNAAPTEPARADSLIRAMRAMKGRTTSEELVELLTKLMLEVRDLEDESLENGVLNGLDIATGFCSEHARLDF